MGDDLVGLGSGAWTLALPIVRRGADGARVEQRGLQACGKPGERLRGLHCTGQGGAAQALERLHCLVTVLVPLLVHRALSVRLARLGIQQHPAVGDTAIGRGHDAGALARAQGGHRLRVGLGEDGLGLTPRGRDTGEPLQLGLGELLEVGSALEGTVGHQRRRARGRVEVRHMVPDDLAERLGITAMTTERWHEERNTSLVRDAQLPHHVVQVRPMIPTLAVGKVHDLVVGGLSAVRTAINMEAGAIEVCAGGGKAQALGGGGRTEAVECRHAIVVERLQGTPERVIVERTGLNGRRNEPRERCILQEMRHEGALLVDEAQAVEDHGLDRMAGGHNTHARVLLGGFIHALSDAEFFKHPCNQAKVIQDLCTVRLRLWRDARAVRWSPSLLLYRGDCRDTQKFLNDT